MKLILGTAEFNPQGYNGEKQPAIKEIRKILHCAKEVGINIIDTAESYNCQDIVKRYAKGFCIYTKTRDWKVTLDWGYNELRGILYHYKEKENRINLPFIHRWVNLGSSVYTLDQLPSDVTRIIQVPVSLSNQTFISCFDTYRTVFVRSVFNRGRLFEEGYSIKECLDYVKQFRPDGIIIGVKSAKELEKIAKEY